MNTRYCGAALNPDNVMYVMSYTILNLVLLSAELKTEPNEWTDEEILKKWMLEGV